MGGMSIWHWLILALVVMLLFGKGRLSDFMSDAGKGIRQFKKGLAEEDETLDRPARPAPRLQTQAPLEPGVATPELQPMKDDRPSA